MTRWHRQGIILSLFYDTVPLVESFRILLRAGDRRHSDYLPVLLCILAENTILSAVHVGGVYFLLQLKKKKSGIYQTSTVHAKNTSIFIRIYVYRYLYLYLSLYSYRYSLHCTYFSFSFICCLACAPCKNFDLHLVTYGCFLCVSMCFFCLAACFITEDELFEIF